jgi:hypothetical protein
MNILKNDQYVSIPRKQYEEMEQIINEKKDVNVRFVLSYYDREYYSNERTWYSSHIIFEMNEQIDETKIKSISEMISSACENVSVIKDAEILRKDTELKSIKSKWWYKLFGE